MTEKHSPPSTQTALLSQSLPPLNPLSPTPPTKSLSSQFSPIQPSSAVVHVNTDTNGTVITPPVRSAPAAKTEPAAEEEPYTIKCICGFTGDDGNTIYCDICDSWQHIECFYPNNSEEATREEFSHACHECKPRYLDVPHAVTYQKHRLDAATAEAAAPQKPKRPPPKSHHGQGNKKKVKPSELHINGHSTSLSDVSRPTFSTLNGGAQHAPSKKKGSHKASQSVGGGSHSKRSPSYSASRATFQPGHPLSPATTPPDLPDGIDVYGSTDFISLCNDQDHVQMVQTNKYVKLEVSNRMSIWLRDPELMLRETGHKFADVFQPLPPKIESLQHPPHVEITKRELGLGMAVHWRYLVTSVAVDKDVPLMELNGQVEFQNSYCTNAANRYEELSCPLPFVFFHPLLPLCIDTRREGSMARFARRSCRPNAVLDTFLSDGSEYHFWLVSDRHIAADEQITLPWDFRLPHDAKARMLRLIGLSDDDTASHEILDVDEDEYNSIARWLSLILSRYGGCACDLGPDCAFARFHRNYSKGHYARNLISAGATANNKKKVSRKAKPRALSPTSTGHATNSRAASEGHLEDFPETDKMSTSSRSKPPSRDMTPAPRQGSFDTLGILTEPTDRDKRKVAMVEDSFRRLEQQQPRKKKRNSDGTSTTDKSGGKSKSKSAASSQATGAPNAQASEHPSNLTHSAPHRHYVDVGTSRSKSGTPDSVVSPQLANGGHGFTSLSTYVSSAHDTSGHATAGPSGYCDAGCQTDPIADQWYSNKPATFRRKRRVVSLSRRLLNNRHWPRVEDISIPAEAALSSSKDTDAPATPSPMPGTAEAVSNTSNDMVLPDAPPLPESQINEPTPNALAPVKTEPGVDAGIGGTPIKKSPDLRVQLPKMPAFGDSGLAPVGIAATPVSASGVVQSPFALSTVNSLNSPVVTPSPIKKKMSLSDYTKSRKAGRPSVGGAPRPAVLHADESKLATQGEGASTGESPTSAIEKTNNALANASTNEAAMPAPAFHLN